MQQRRRERLPEQWVVGAVFVSAMFLNILDSTIVTVALPTLGEQFDVRAGSIEWVVTGYLLALAAFIPASGWIGDRFGTKRAFLIALGIFLLGSALCGAAQNLEQLIAFRMLQGAGGGMLMPVGTAMLFRAFPPSQRASAARVLIVPTVAAPALGPIIGGFLVDHLSWRWIFFVNLPIGIAAFAFGLAFLREHREPRRGGFDLAGFVLSGGGLALVLFALAQGPSTGWTSASVLGPGVAGITAFAVLVRVELATRYPMLHLRLLGDRLFRSANVAALFGYGGFIGFLFVMPLFLQQAHGLSAFESGLTTFPEALGVLVSSQIAGRVYLHVGPRRLMVGGLVTVSCLMLSLTQVGADTNLWVIRAVMFAIGAGMAFVFVPLQAATYATITPAETGQATAIFSTQRQVAAALGVAVLATTLAGRLPEGEVTPAQRVDAFHTVYLVAASITFLGALASLAIPDRDAAETMAPRGATGDGVAAAAH